MEAAWLGLAITRFPRGGFAPFVALYLLNFGIYGVLVTGIRRGGLSPPSPWILWGGALLFRLTLLPFEPTLSDDLYRYLWEGHIQAEGFNPFLVEPSAPELAHLRDEVFGRVNHPGIPTIYPPLMQFLFHAVTRLSYTTWAMKGMSVAFDLGTLALVVNLARRRGSFPGAAVIYAWSPLVILEFAGSGHNDSVFLFLAVLAVRLAVGKRSAGAALALGGSILAKLVSLIYLPLHLRLLRARWLLLIPPLVVLCYLPYTDAGAGLFEGLGRFAGTWRFNGSLFPFLEGVVGDAGVGRVIAALLLLAVVSREALRGTPRASSFVGITGALLLLSPTVHPWYVTWLVPFLALSFRWSWFLWTGSVIFAYHVLIGFQARGIWMESPWVPWLEYVPVYAGLLAGTWWRRRGWARPGEDLLPGKDVGIP
jgi:alpha-1,6-mannosyltransferase